MVFMRVRHPSTMCICHSSSFVTFPRAFLHHASDGVREPSPLLAALGAENERDPVGTRMISIPSGRIRIPRSLTSELIRKILYPTYSSVMYGGRSSFTQSSKLPVILSTSVMRSESVKWL